MNGDRSHSHLFQNVIVGLTLVAGPMTTCWVGCSSTAIESELPARVTASADPIHRTIRPVPEVISRPKPFRLPDFVGAAAPGTEPVTMQSADMQPGSLLAGGSPEQPPGELLQRIKTQPAATEIREMMLGYLQAFNRHDSLALAAHWSSTGENVDLDSGATTAGRDAVEQVFSALFAEDAEATIDIEIDSIRPLRQDVAVVDGVTLITFTNEPPSSSRFSAVVVKQDGCWMLESVRESAQPLPLNSQHRPLDELGWLVGSWEDIGEGVTASTHCFWSTGKAFIIRSHAVTFDDLPSEHAAISEQTKQSEPEDSAGPAIPDLLVPGCGVSREITEIIGWDSQRRQIRSWILRLTDSLPRASGRGKGIAGQSLCRLDQGRFKKRSPRLRLTSATASAPSCGSVRMGFLCDTVMMSLLMSCRQPVILSAQLALRIFPCSSQTSLADACGHFSVMIRRSVRTVKSMHR